VISAWVGLPVFCQFGFLNQHIITMKKTVTIIAAFLMFPGVYSFGQAPADQMLPPPEFAREHQDLSVHAEELEGIIGGLAMGGTEYEHGQMIRYTAVDHDTRVFLTDLPVEEVRTQYLELLMEDMEDQGMPPESLEQYRGFLETEVVQPVSTDAFHAGDMETLEQYYRQAGIDLPAGYVECLREIDAKLDGQSGQSFTMEMNERNLRRQDPVQPGDYFTIVKVEVQQPYMNTLDCSIMEETAIIYTTYRMQLSAD